MKKIFKFLNVFVFTFLILFTSLSVNAKNIEITIDDIKVSDKSSNTTVSNTSFSDDTLTSDINFSDVGDYVIFDVDLKNISDEDYEIIDITDNNSISNIEISYDYTKEFSKKDSKKIKVKVLYKEKVVNRDSLSIDDLVLTLTLKANDGTNLRFRINNPNTGDNILHYLVLLIISITGIGFLIISLKKKNKSNSKIASLVLLFVLIAMPFCIFAVEKININIKIRGIVLESEYLPYEVSFNTNGGNNIDSRTITYGQAIGELPEGEKNGYTFNGWKDKDGNQVTEETIVTKNLELVGDFTPIEYSISYDLKGGSVSGNPTKYTIEDEVTLKNPTRRGYTFAGWTGSNGETLLTRVTLLNETGNKSYTANWSTNDDTPYKVIHKYRKLDNTFEENIENLTGATDTVVEAPRSPRVGFVTPDAQNVLITATDDIPTVTYIYERVQCTLTVNDDVDTTFTNDSYPYGTEITLTAKDKTNFEFTSWSNGGTTKTITFTITENTNIYPNYTRVKYKVIFEANEGTITETERNVNVGSAIGDLPVVTPPEGKELENWYDNASGGNVVTSSYQVNSDLTVYARYVDQTFTVSFNTDNGSGVANQTITYGNKVTRPDDPTKGDYRFIDWYTDNTYSTLFDFENTEIYEDKTIFAKWILPVVYFQLPPDWYGSTVNAYVLDSATDTGIAWPGDAMTLVDSSKHIYSYLITNTEIDNYDKIVFTNGQDVDINHVLNSNARQTIDIDISNDMYGKIFVPELYTGEGTRVLFMNGSKNWVQHIYLWNDTENNIWPGSEFTDSVNKETYYTIIDSKYTKMIFNKGKGGTGNQTNDLDVPSYQDMVYNLNNSGPCRIFYFGSWKNYSEWNDSGYAEWTATGSHYDKFLESSSTYRVTFNSNGGSVTETSINVTKTNCIGTLPVPTPPEGKSFDGWYTSLTDGYKVDDSYVPNGNVVLFAKYND